ncbi:MAG: acetyl-CoA carboxylase carboxyl transferase subunit beta, partial [Eubacteriaceae bacterium]
MLKKGLFKKPTIELEVNTKNIRKKDPNIPYELCTKCPSCHTMSFTSDLEENFFVCPKCGYHYRINARQRLNLLCDPQSFLEHDVDIVSENILSFPNYDDKLEQAKAFSHEKEGVI